MIFVDASFYISLLKPTDSNHDAAVALAREHGMAPKLTSQAILGEVATVGSQRFSKEATIAFVEDILRGSTTTVLFETHELVIRAWEIFKMVKSKNISWVDCYSVAIIEAYKIKTVLTFDKDLARLASGK
ncbi:MAG: PIN domain-containing protein [Candidatus Gottesmanbacteria bacterium]|nr:PIN domain-containing protein [Candidatus Gottesmanbacteria bacterium]